LKRIWWCPTGPLTFLPLHAATTDIASRNHETSKFVISSYIPSVNALIEARAKESQASSGLLAVGMTKSPGYGSPLPNAKQEILEVKTQAGRVPSWRFTQLQNEDATKEEVLKNMTNSSWIHLACHGVQDLQNPIRSGLVLTNAERLKIMDIVEKQSISIEFAFLSACETATGEEKVSDEALHITGGMLAAGCRSVIGTMWSIPDAAAPLIAKEVYEHLLPPGKEPDSSRAAQALHEAVSSLRSRDEWSQNVHAWAPFVHYGA